MPVTITNLTSDKRAIPAPINYVFDPGERKVFQYVEFDEVQNDPRLKKLIDDGIISATGGTPASEVPYDNTTSGLAATEVNDAIDEAITYAKPPASIKMTTPWLHTSDTNWTAVTGGSTGSITLEDGAEYKFNVSAEMKSSNVANTASLRLYDITNIQELIAFNSIETADGDWKNGFVLLISGAGAREYRLEGKIDNAAQTVTVNQAHVTIEKI